MNRHRLLSCIVLMTAAACSAADFNTTVKRGVWGQVTLTTGNCMPSVDDESKCHKEGAAQEVYIFEPVRTADMDVTYLKGEGKVIKQVKPNSDGFYEAELPPGTYSVFVDDDGRKYCNLFGGQPDETCRVTVKDGLERFDINIDHAAW
jgi:hypothetical protein